MSMRYPGGFISSTAPTVNANTAKGVWTLEQAMQYAKAGLWPVPTGNGDPYFQFNALLLPGQGTNGSNNNTFLDSSNNNFTITRNGNTTQGTFTPFSQADGYWSNYFDGGDSFSLSNSTPLNLSGVSYTIEGWINPDGNYTNYNIIIAKRNASNSSDCPWEVYQAQSSGALGFYNGTVYVSAAVPPARRWSHFAAVYDGGNINLYLNGTRVLRSAITNYDSAVPIYIGSFTPLNEDYIGHISNIRITKGAALYTGDTFSVPTAALTTTVPSGTVSLLTCQSSRFIDNSVNAATLTVNGAPKVSPFEPLGAPTTTYSPSTVGGSGYFDGSGDYLTIANNSAFLPGTGNFTIEAWVYPTSYTPGAADCVASCYQNGTTGWTIAIGTGSGVFYGAVAGDSQQINSTVTPSQQWFHLVLVRSGTTLAFFVNGVRAGTLTDSTNITSTTELSIGTNVGGGSLSLNGYMSGLRVVKGTAVYDPTQSTLTIPTAPPTAITNTQVLLNYTNAGVIDNAIKNDLETVGNAQISSGQYKWGGSSINFDGTGDWLAIPAGSQFAFGTGDYTVEAWVYFTSISTSVLQIIFMSGSTAGNTFYFHADGDQLSVGTSSTFISNQATSFTTNTWYHVAACRTGGTLKLYVNGNQIGSSVSDTTNWISSGTARVGANESNAQTFYGYIQDLRVSRYSRYPYSFAIPTAAFPLFYQAAPSLSYDPYFEYNTLLLPGNGTNGAQNNTFLDSSTNAFSITRNGNTTQGTFTPFSQTGWSLRTNDRSYLSMTANSDLDLINTDFTVEFWWKFNAFNTMQYSGNNLFGNGASNASNGWFTSFGGSGDTVTTLSYSVWSGGSVTGNNFTVSINKSQWNHIAFVRSGSGAGNLKLYINGTQVGAAQSAVTYSSAGGTFTLGSGSYTQNGTYSGNSDYYISNVRLTKSAVYTSDFTVPTSALTALAATTLLICQSNRLINNGSYNATVSSGSFTSTLASIEAFSPFNPTAAYSTSTVGGSGYFDGTGDYLTAPSNAAFAVGSVFTIEFWLYPTAYGANPVFIYLDESSGGLQFGLNGGNLGVAAAGVAWRLTGSAGPTRNTWNHCVLVRSGTGSNQTSIFLNGTRIANGTVTDAWTTNVQAIIQSTQGTSYLTTGYMSNIRIVKGTAVYDPTQSTLTIPTAPLTAISGTSLLLSGTNGAIADATAKNDIETVGGASTSTTQSKFGGSSMYFDGNGDYLIMPNILNGQFGTGDFTIEYWDYHGTQGTNYADQVGTLSSGTPAGTWRFGTFTNGGGLYFSYHNGSSYVDVQFGSAAYNDTTWRHFAISRYSGVLYAFVNGIQVGTATACTQDFNSSNRVILGAELVNPTYFTGYLQDVRVTKGIARYTSNFAPPSTALPLL